MSKTSTLAAVKRIINSSTLTEGWYLLEGWEVALNSYQALQFQNILNDLDLPQTTSKLNPMECWQRTKHEPKRLVVPTLAELKEYIKTCPKDKKTNRQYYDFCEADKSQPRVDAQYLKTMLEAMEVTDCFYSSNVEPIYFEGKDYKGGKCYGVLMPVRRVTT